MSTKYAPQQKNVVRIDFNFVGLGKRLDSEIARDLGVPRRRVTKERAKRNIPAFTKANPGAKVTRDRRVDAAQPATKPITQVIADTPVTAAPKQKPPKAAPKKKILTNYIAVVIDESGSMSYIRNDVVNVFNGLANTIRENAKATDQRTKVSLWTFQTGVTKVFDKVDADKLTELALDNYAPGGLTALYDAVGQSIESFKAVKDADDEDTSFLIIVVTDGEENSSQKYAASQKGGERLAELMLDVQRTGRWSLVFNVPPGQRSRVINEFKIPSDNVREWEGSTKGLSETYVQTSGGISHFYTSRASGQTSVQNFFVTTDLSRVDPKDIRSKLDDVSDRFKGYTLEKEEDVKEFVERKTHKPYIIGSTYYQLFKKEKVSATKKVIIQELGKKALWSGDEARTLIGLPKGVDAKVTPGNHAGYKIFVQSKSVNRRLPRGTEIIVDTQKSVSDAPTWDHTKVTS